MATYYINQGDFLIFKQTLTSNPYGAAASNFLSFLQKAMPGLYHQFAQNRLLLDQKLKITRPITNIVIHQSLAFFGVTHKTLPQHVIHVIPLYHFAKVLAGFQAFGDTLGFIQVATALLVKPTSSVISIEQTATYNAVFNVSVTDTLALESDALGYILDPNFVAIPIVIPGPPGGDNGHGP